MTHETQLELPFGPHPVSLSKLYGCNSKRSGDYGLRGRQSILHMQVGRRTVWIHDPNGCSMFPITVPEFEAVSTDWKSIPCGYMERKSDTACSSCVNQLKETQ